MLRTIFGFICIMIIGLIAASWAVDIAIQEEMSPYLYTDPAALPTERTGLVLGAQVIGNQIPSQALENRLSTAAKAYQIGKLNGVLMSGDGRSSDYNEVAVMQRYALEADIPPDKVQTDPAGLRTLDSCLRAKNIFHLTAVTIITQPDHLRRAVYTCRRVGLDAIGLAAPDFKGGNGDLKYWEYRLRERGAILLAWLQVGIVPPGSSKLY